MNFDEKLSEMIGDDGIKVPGLGVIVYKDGREIYSKFLGKRVIETSKPVTRDTRFRVASVSKMFTIFSVMQLVEQKKIFLDEDAEKYLNFPLRNPACPQKKITVRMLASHLSSIRDGKIYSIPPNFSVEEFFSPSGKFWENGNHFAPPEEKIGEYFTYSNLSYGLLGTIIESVTNKRFDVYQKENLFEPLEIKADYLPGNFKSREFNLLGTIYQKKNPQGIWNEQGAWFGKADDFNGIQPPKDTVRLQNPYAENFQGVYDLKNYQVGTNATIFSPQGGLRISFEELAHALEMMMSGGFYRGRKILKPESLTMMFKSSWIYDSKNGRPYGGAILNYGLGTYFVDGKSTARLCKMREINFIGHTGVAFGLISGVFFIPHSKSGLVYMMNGTAIEEDTDPRSFGQFSKNYIWEEKIMSTVCDLLNL